MGVKVISDSTCDLSQELTERYDIDIIPLHVVLGEEEYLDGVTITPEQLYAWSDAHKSTPKTSALSMDMVMDAMKPALDRGDEVVIFSISSEMSTTANVMRMAAEELGASDRVFVVDSRNLSTGVGIQAIMASELAQQGKTGAEIVAYLKDVTPRVRTSFVVDVLTYLYRGGRCSGLAALAGSALKLHPRIGVADGKMSPGKKYRGHIDKFVMAYVKDQEEALLHADSRRIFITHSGGAADTVVPMVMDYLKSLNHFEEILVTRAGSVISSHCGPGTLGLLYVDAAEAN